MYGSAKKVAASDDELVPHTDSEEFTARIEAASGQSDAVIVSQHGISTQQSVRNSRLDRAVRYYVRLMLVEASRLSIRSCNIFNSNSPQWLYNWRWAFKMMFSRMFTKHIVRDACQKDCSQEVNNGCHHGDDVVWYSVYRW
ncbi:hypothetical protein MRB53_037236 [Persea americana]|nr:hypothetical protein MRB53_037236 [Persea americana]